MGLIAAATTMVTNAGTTGVAASSTPQPRLVRAAHEFEAQMMKELLKPMTGANSLMGEEDDSDSGTGGALGEYASEALGRALSNQGGFGIANKIVSDLSHSGNGKVTGSVTTNMYQNTHMKVLK
jgi:Rod binding domain-containing protein